MLLVRTWHLWFSLPTFFIFSSASLILDFNIADPSTILMYNVSFTTANCRRESVPLYSSNNWRFSSFFCYEKSLFRFYVFFEKPVFVLLIIFSFQAWLLHLCSALFRSPHISRWAISFFAISFMHIWFCIRRLQWPHYLYPSRFTCTLKC